MVCAATLPRVRRYAARCAEPPPAGQHVTHIETSACLHAAATAAAISHGSLSCRMAYSALLTPADGRFLTQQWGSFAPDTQEVQLHHTQTMATQHGLRGGLAAVLKEAEQLRHLLLITVDT
jgi:hypothetical protein